MRLGWFKNAELYCGDISFRYTDTLGLYNTFSQMNN